jgi:hypothetical protein
MAVWFMRWLQGVLCEQSPLFDAASPALPEAREHHQSIVGMTRFAPQARVRLHPSRRNHLKGGSRRHQIVRGPYHREGRSAWP